MSDLDQTAMIYPQKRETRVSHTFFSSDADVIFESADGVLLYIHRKNLETCTGAFPPCEIPTNEEHVPLSESGEILELLFKFVYPARHPDLDEFGIDIVAPLAEAAEKYEVYPAMNVCQQRMADFIPLHGVDVYFYALKHDYPRLITQSLPSMIGRPLSEVIPVIPPHLVLPWLLYTEAWERVRRELSLCTERPTAYYVHGTPCGEWSTRSEEILRCLLQGVKSLLDLDALFHWESARPCCKKALANWRETAEERIKKIPQFQTFVHG